jgi:Fic family protein
VLENSQKGTLDVTRWLAWYLNCLRRAINASDHLLESVLIKDGFWKLHTGETFNDRQRKVINRLLDGFEGRLTSSKWAKLAKFSQDTAGRDINDLLDQNPGQGRGGGPQDQSRSQSATIRLDPKPY